MQVNEDKRLLIQSMKKLSYHISNNPKRQQDIFSSLSLPDLNKIIANLHDSNQYLRRVSALLLCELTYNNLQIKLKMAEMLGAFPCQGRICLSGFSNDIAKHPQLLKNCVQLLHSKLSMNEQTTMCWIIDLERKKLKIQFLDFKKYSSFTFIDPSKNMFGYTLSSNQNRQKLSTHSISPIHSPISKNKYVQVDKFNKTIQLSARTDRLQRSLRSSDKVKLTIDLGSRDKRHRDQLLQSYRQAKERRSPKDSIKYNYGIMSVESGNKTSRESQNASRFLEKEQLRKTLKNDFSPLSGRKITLQNGIAGNRTDRYY